MCYVHNQWYDISCATLYICGFQNTIYGQRIDDSPEHLCGLPFMST